MPPVPVAAQAADAVLAALARTEFAWLLLAIALHVAGQLCRGVAWREVLAPTWPAVTRRRACMWHVCGAGLTGVLSARGGDAVRVLLARRELPGAACAALAGSLLAEASLAGLCGLMLTLAALSVGVGALTAPPAGLLGGLGVAAVLALLLASVSQRVRCAVLELKCGAAIIGDPGRFTRHVLPWQLGNRCLRLASIWCFVQSVGLPAEGGVVLAVFAAQSAGNSVPLPLANVATTAAALAVSLPIAAGQPIEAGAIAALALIAPVTLTLVGLSVSLVLLTGLLGVRRPLELLRAVSRLGRRTDFLTPAVGLRPQG